MTVAIPYLRQRHVTDGRCVAGHRMYCVAGRLRHGRAKRIIAAHRVRRVVEHADVHRDDGKCRDDEQQPNHPPVKHGRNRNRGVRVCSIDAE